MYYSDRGPTSLIPDIWEPDATDLTDILCDQPPGVAGVGAATIAMQALGLSAGQAAALVGSQGATNVSTDTLTGAVNQSNLPNPLSILSSNGARLPITATVNPAVQFLAGDPNRVILIIQNNEPTAGGATLLVSFDAITSASPGYYLNFGPGGFGILLDRWVFNNPIYVGWSGTPTVGGMMMYGSRPSQPSGANVLRPQFIRAA